MWENVWNKKENKLILIKYEEINKMDNFFKKYEWLIRLKDDGII